MQSSITRWVEGRDGTALDARVDVASNSVTLHSRGGSNGGRPARNTQYELALQEICRRGKASGAFSRILIDSAPSRQLDEERRTLLREAEIAALDAMELAAAIRTRLRLFGQADGVTGGNGTKRVRFDLKAGKTVQMLRLRADPPPAIQSSALAGSDDDPLAIAAILDGIDDEEARRFAEGSKSRALHLRRERNRDLVDAFKTDFLRRHPRFFCEACGSDWIDEYGVDVASAVFDAHHAATYVAAMQEDHESSIDDLQLLCANCHRAEHRRMQLGGDDAA